jgi:universal stress protein A
LAEWAALLPALKGKLDGIAVRVSTENVSLVDLAAAFKAIAQTTQGGPTVRTLFRKILCPIDFDVNSIAVLQYARDLARQNDATLHVLHVVYLPLGGPHFPLEPYPAVSEDPSKLELEKIAREHLDGRVRYELAARTGKPAEAINQAAEDFDVDLIVMATHGKTGVTRLFLGSVAEDVVRTSKRPVLTIRPTASDQIPQAAAARNP